MTQSQAHRARRNVNGHVTHALGTATTRRSPSRIHIRGLRRHPLIPFAPTTPSPSASFAFADHMPTWETAMRKPLPTANRRSALEPNLVTSLTVRENPSALNFSSPRAAPAKPTACVIAAQDVVPSSTELLSALAGQLTKPTTPLLFQGWQNLMERHHLVDKYPNVLSTLQHIRKNLLSIFREI